MTDRDAFRTVFHDHYDDVLGYAIRRSESRADAEDVAAETFSIAWRRIDSMPHGHDARLWLFGVARRVLGNQRRGHRRARRLFRKVAHAEHSIRPPDAGGSTSRVGERERIRQALGALREQDREVLRLHVWEGLTAAQIAHHLDCTEAAIWKRLQRARDRLALALQRLDDASAPERASPRPPPPRHEHLPCGADTDA